MKAMFSVAGKTVLVSGGTSGIGRAVAHAFLRAGASVLAAGLPSEEPLDPAIRSVPLDVTSAEDVEQVLAPVDRLDVLVNAAGIIRRDQEFDLAVFREVLDVNLTARCGCAWRRTRDCRKRAAAL